MVKLNRTTEYGLIALRHMSRKGGMEAPTVTSAREVADCYGLPFEITAKTLQRLRDSGFIQSAQGARGGYTLARSLRDVTLGEFLREMEGPQSVVSCAGGNPSLKKGDGCEYETRCEMQGVMGELNRRVQKFLGEIRLAEITDGTLLGGNFRELPVSWAGQEP